MERNRYETNAIPARKQSLRRVAALLGLLVALMTPAGLWQETGYAADSSAADLLAAMGVISADSSGSYRLSGTVSRAEFAKMLIMASVYQDTVQTAAASSPFQDVPADHWAAACIKTAAANGLLSGYSDGTFRPGEPIRLEQAVNAVLKLLGYTQEDFSGAFPHAQMNLYAGIGLSAGIGGSAGTQLMKQDAVKLIYNLLNTAIKGDTKKYAETLGYSLNAAGEVDYAAVVSDKMNGPFTVRSSDWPGELNVASGAVVYRNGVPASQSDVKTYDILYVSKWGDVVWAYDKKVTGVYEKAAPGKADVTAVTVGGKEYTLESAAAFSVLSASGSLQIGQTVTLLLGKNGQVADAVSTAEVSVADTVYVTGVGTKVYENDQGESYQSGYITGINISGEEVELPLTLSWVKQGDVLHITFDASGAQSVQRAGSVSVSGTVSADAQTIGSAKVADRAILLDTADGAYAWVSLQRLSGVTVKEDDVLYARTEGGEITAVIFDDISGDSGQYGVLTKAKKNSGGSSVSGEYAWLADGAAGSQTTQNSAFSVSTGPVRILLSGNQIQSVQNLKRISETVSSFDGNTLRTASGMDWTVSGRVSVYQHSYGEYQQRTPADARQAFQEGKELTFYYNEKPSEGGQIRIILLQA